MKVASADPTAVDNEFVRMEDLIGRHVLIVPHEVKTLEGRPDPNDPKRPTHYDVVVSDVIVLDGRKNDKIHSLPRVQLDMYVSGKGPVADVKRYIGSSDPVLGYINKPGNAYVFEKADPDVAANEALLDDAWALYREEKGSEDPPF